MKALTETGLVDAADKNERPPSADGAPRSTEASLLKTDVDPEIFDHAALNLLRSAPAMSQAERSNLLDDLERKRTQTGDSRLLILAEAVRLIFESSEALGREQALRRQTEESRQASLETLSACQESLSAEQRKNMSLYETVERARIELGRRQERAFSLLRELRELRAYVAVWSGREKQWRRYKRVRHSLFWKIFKGATIVEFYLKKKLGFSQKSETTPN